VSDAVGAIEGLEADSFFQVAQLALGATDLQAVAIAGNRDPGGVVAAILQPPQSIDDDGHDALLANATDYAAHARQLLNLPGGECTITQTMQSILRCKRSRAVSAV
jgi:hypothetical protein